jgi:spermidine synthase
VLNGGLGMGFTLRAALARLPAGGRVVVAELAEAVVAWNRDLLGPAAAAGLADPRVTVVIGDVAESMRAGGRFDAILLDVDNSPHALTHPGNQGLYTLEGLAAARRALAPAGRLAIWSASRHPELARRLARAGFAVEVHAARARGPRGGATHTIYLGQAPP